VSTPWQAVYWYSYVCGHILVAAVN
jgi:hypothetical protein